MTDKNIGTVYILRNEAMPGIYKIGVTSQDDLNKRINELYQGQTSVPLPFECEFACKVKNYKKVEKHIHDAFRDYRINPNREFFNVNPERVISILQLLKIEDTTVTITEQINDTVPEVDKISNKQFRDRRPNLNFIEMGLTIGERIVFVDESNPIEVEIMSKNSVRYNDAEYSLTKLTQELRGASYAVAPCPYWTHNGKSLNDYYNETYTKTE